MLVSGEQREVSKKDLLSKMPFVSPVKIVERCS